MKPARIIKFALTIIVLCSVQVSAARYIKIFGTEPNIVLAFVISVSVVCGPVSGGAVGLACGIITDSLSSGMTVLNSLAYMYSGALCGYFAANYLRKNISAAFFFTLTASLICEEAAHFLHFAIWDSSGFFAGLLFPIIPTAIYSAFSSIPVYALTNALFGNKCKEAMYK